VKVSDANTDNHNDNDYLIFIFIIINIVVGFTIVSVWISRGIQYWQALVITRVAGE